MFDILGSHGREDVIVGGLDCNDAVIFIFAAVRT
jgi:hypothetical protein